MRDRTPEERLQALEDVEALRRLTAEYCAACDDDHDPDRVAALFSEDGVWEADGIGRFEGRAAIREHMAALRKSGGIRRSAHNVTNPILDVRGDRANGEWRLVMLYSANVPGGGIQRFRVIGRYLIEYVRVSSGWLHRSLHCRVEEHGPEATPLGGTAGDVDPA